MLIFVLLFRLKHHSFLHSISLIGPPVYDYTVERVCSLYHSFIVCVCVVYRVDILLMSLQMVHNRRKTSWKNR